MTVGVLALQGDFAEHETMLKRLGVATREVRLPSDLDGLDALVIPGGESTTITRLIQNYELMEPLRRFGRERPVWGTCAGAIVMARHASDLDRPTIDLMDIDVRRNAFGRQVDSFETDIAIKGMAGPPLHAIFIRAPTIESVGEGVEVLGRLEGGEIVAARQGHMLATSFHPELTEDLRMHKLFVSWIENEASHG
ncbi:MAG TPA: pyridoxal 5'-phosphate synthase glutaminase subunit PdxT [Dehalococcoidia bacterium]